MKLDVSEVSTRRDLSRFIGLPCRLHRTHPAFVPPLISEVKSTLSREKNPFFAHADMKLFLCYKDGEVLGRIAAIVDRNYIATRGDDIGLIGFFDAVDSVEVASALFDAAGGWLEQVGMRAMLGPASPSMNDEIGVVVMGFEHPPMIKMPWNPHYYPALYETCGFTKAKDLRAYIASRESMSERLLAIGEARLRRSKFTIRNVDMKRFEREVELLRLIYNSAWTKNWGFVPWTAAEFDHVAKSLRQVVDPALIFIAEDDGKPAGFSLALPDLNMALKRINGRLFPFGLPLLLWHARKINRVRVAVLGVLPEYRNRALDVIFYYKSFHAAMKRGYFHGEMSWILEDNIPMVKAAESMGAEWYKTYRLYEKRVKVA